MSEPVAPLSPEAMQQLLYLLGRAICNEQVLAITAIGRFKPIHASIEKEKLEIVVGTTQSLSFQSLARRKKA